MTTKPSAREQYEAERNAAFKCAVKGKKTTPTARQAAEAKSNAAFKRAQGKPTVKAVAPGMARMDAKATARARMMTR